MQKNHSKRQRPGERVLGYLNDTFIEAEVHTGTRLPTAHELSESLDVGISTVQKVYQKLVQEGALEAIPGRGTFVARQRKGNRIALSFGSVGDLATEVWQSRIAAAIVQDGDSLGIPQEIIPFHPGDEGSTGEFLAEKFASVDGAILFPHPDLEALIQNARDAEIPWVTLHPVKSQDTADFVSPDYISGCKLIGKASFASGRKRIALVQAHPAGGASASNFLRSAGLLDAIGPRLGDEVKLRIFDANTASYQTGREAAANLFSKDGFQPDLVFCMGDFLAHGFLSWLRDHNISCPKKVSLIAGTGLIHDPDPFPGMTCMRQPLEALGKEMLKLLLRRIEVRLPIPGIFIKNDFVGGETTLPAENAVLFSKDDVK